MKTPLVYREIPRAERKLLAAEAYRRSKTLRMIRFAAVFLPILLGGALTQEVGVSAAVVLCFAIWESIGRPKLRAEVERLRNA
jgi:hypothetical protein